MACIEKKKNVLLRGNSGSGRSSIVKYLSYKTNNFLRRVSMHKFYEIEDFQKRLKFKNNKFDS